MSWPAPPTSMPPYAAARRPCPAGPAPPRPSGPTRMHRFAAVLAGHGRGVRLRRVAAGGKPHPADPGFDVPGTVDNTAFFAGAARHLEGRAAGEYSGDHTSTSAASRSASSARSRRGTTRCRWPPGRSCPAIAAGNTIVLKPAELTPLTSLMFAQAGTEAGHPGRRRQRRHRRRARRPASTWSATPASRWSPSPARPRSASGSMEIAAATVKRRAPGARRQGARSWCSTTPTSRPPSTARSPAR